MPNFDEHPDTPKKPKRAPRREQPGANVGRRINMAARGDGSVRATFHNTPVDLPPPPSLRNQYTDHSYAMQRTI